VSDFDHRLWIEPEVFHSRDMLPGNIRQRVKKRIDALRIKPRPPDSKRLNIDDLEVPVQIEIRRLRLSDWRIIYAVNDNDAWVWVLAIHRRPPYDYDDLGDIAKRVKG
jgi:mRNA interferase RelE/StbE